MTLMYGFITESPFYDDAHFPRGFSKSGDFGIAEAELLTTVGKRLFMLEQAICEPQNQVEEQFVQMCTTQTQSQSKIELLWKKYKYLTRYKQYNYLSGRT
jgi:uncharacterized protein YifE (UPF0438 family)